MENTRTVAGTALSTPLLATGWGQPARQSLARSSACALLANGADVEEIAAAVAPLADNLRDAIAGYQAEAAPLRDLADDAMERFIADEVGGFVRLTGGGWMPEQRQEFIDQCCIEFALLPTSVLVPAIRQARRKVFDPKRFVSWIFEFVDKDLNRLEAEGKTLARLAEIAQI